MAQKRYLDKKISTSEKVADLPIIGQLIYTWALPWADDFGLLQASARTIKAQIIPMVDVLLSDVEEAIEKMIDLGLFIEVRIADKNFWKIVHFEENQKFRTDINPWVIFPFNYSHSPTENWRNCEQIVSKAIQNISNSVTSRDESVTSRNFPRSKIREDKINIYNTGISDKKADALTEPDDKQKNGMQKLKSLLEEKGIRPSTNGDIKTPPNGIHTQWQDKAFRYAKGLHIELDPKTKPRWLKVFKEADAGKNKVNLEKAYTYLVDYPKELNPQEKVKYFFYIFENGLKENFNLPA